MPKVIFIQPTGEAATVDAQCGDNLMSVAVNNMINGIPGECGGSPSCATCHVHVSESWLPRLEEPSEIERDLLDGILNTSASSRLSCQIVMSNELDGIEVSISED